MARWHKEKAREAAAGTAPTREDVIFDIQQVMTLLAELKHEPHGGGRQAALHGKRLAELMHTLDRDLAAVPEGEQSEYHQDIQAIRSLSVDGQDGEKLGDYLDQNKASEWGKDYASYWEKGQHNEAMRKELHEVMQQLRGSLHHRHKS